ncbi:MAG: hypothetical protein CMJ34_01235 [Phycisphaerae bacterium]|nr:hypothetical protein [Phycisphaerae bacterium]
MSVHQADEADIEERWATLRVALADGRVDDESRMEFWCLLERRLRRMILDGPANDVGASRVRGRFAGILRDPHAAEDFLSELAVDLVRRFEEGFYHHEDFRNLGSVEGLGRIASFGFVRKRAISHLRRGAAAGVVGLPRDAGGARSLDGGEEGGLAATLVAAEGDSMDEDSSSGLELLAGARDGQPVLQLDLDRIRATAVIATAGLELDPVLDPGAESHPRIVEAVGSTLRRDLEPDPDTAVSEAHARARRELEGEIGRAVDEIVEHPGMEVATIERWERRIAQARARLVIQPLDGRTLADLCGLPSTNAGEQRISNYRKALHDLLPQLAALVAGEGDS